MDMKTNPFRCRKETSLGSPSLLHAILALSGHHNAKQLQRLSIDHEVVNHRDTAAALYRNALVSPQIYSAGLHLLDTAIILFAFDVCIT